MSGRRWLGWEALFSGNSSPCPSASLGAGRAGLGGPHRCAPGRAASMPSSVLLALYNPSTPWKSGTHRPQFFSPSLLAPASGRRSDRAPLSLLLFIYCTARARLSFLVFPRDAALGGDTKFRSPPSPVF